MFTHHANSLRSTLGAAAAIVLMGAVDHGAALLPNEAGSRVIHRRGTFKRNKRAQAKRRG